MRDLEEDLKTSNLIKQKVLDRTYAEKLYSALCNIQWKHRDDTPEQELWSCTWRYAGGILADIRDAEEDYIDFYCGGNEGLVDKEIEEDLASLGWKWSDWQR